jgi:hypothetical protein
MLRSLIPWELAPLAMDRGSEIIRDQKRTYSMRKIEPSCGHEEE